MKRQSSHYRWCGRSIAILCVLSTWVLSKASANDPGRQTTVQPQDNGQALVNPGMGWTLHFYSNLIENYGSKLEPSDTLDDWPGLSVIYLRVPWSFLEPQEGKFNWSLFDTPTQRWVAKGKKIAIRVSCCESWWRYATPKWVQDAGAKGIDFEFGKGPRSGGPLWEPDYLDPVFLEKLDHFLAALARHYDGNPNVAFIDIGSFGMWGEGHTGFSSRLSQTQTSQVVKKHIDLHLKHFHQTLLVHQRRRGRGEQAGPALPRDRLRDLQRRHPARRQHPRAAAAPLLVSRRDGPGVLAPLAGDPGARALRLPRRPARHGAGDLLLEVGRGLPCQLHVDPLVAARGT